MLDESDRPIPVSALPANTMAVVETGVSRRWKPHRCLCCSATLAALDMGRDSPGERCRHTGRPRARPNALMPTDARRFVDRHPQRSRPRKHMCSTSTGRGSGGSAGRPRACRTHSVDQRPTAPPGKCGDRPAERHRPAVGHPPRDGTRVYTDVELEPSMKVHPHVHGGVRIDPRPRVGATAHQPGKPAFTGTSPSDTCGPDRGLGTFNAEAGSNAREIVEKRLRWGG